MFMKINFLPSLEHIAVVKIAVAVCDHPDLKVLMKEMKKKGALIDTLHFDVSGGTWDILQCKILEVLHSSELTWVVMKKVVGVMKSIICQIDVWKYYHKGIVDMDLPHNRLCWKADGTLDRMRIAKTLIRDETIEVDIRFILACNYCLADDVRDLWNRMSDTLQLKFSDAYASQDFIVRLWIDSIKRGTGVNWKRLARKCSTDNVLKENALALPNFFENLTSKLKLRCLRGVAGSGLLQPDDLRVCLPQLNEKREAHVVEEEPAEVLFCLLMFPLQGMFIDVANSLWSHISQRDFRYLLNFILRTKIALGWSDFDYIELFQSFWRNSPAGLKEFIRTDTIFPSVMFVVDHVQSKPFPRQRLLELLETQDI